RLQEEGLALAPAFPADCDPRSPGGCVGGSGVSVDAAPAGRAAWCPWGWRVGIAADFHDREGVTTFRYKTLRDHGRHPGMQGWRGGVLARATPGLAGQTSGLLR